MEREVANAVNCLFVDDFDLFVACDRPALMDLIEEYYCGEDPDDMSSDDDMDGPLVEDYSESLSVAAAIASTTLSLCAQMNPLQVVLPPSSALQTVTPSAVPSASPQTTTPPGCSTPVTTKSSSSLADSDSQLEHFLEKGCG